jgi:hypothetical protein
LKEPSGRARQAGENEELAGDGAAFSLRQRSLDALDGAQLAGVLGAGGRRELMGVVAAARRGVDATVADVENSLVLARFDDKAEKVAIVPVLLRVQTGLPTQVLASIARADGIADGVGIVRFGARLEAAENPISAAPIHPWCCLAASILADVDAVE